ncbi:methyltransferase N6AMT1 isoform X3 [Odocoileus virginianus]|uniref:Methyltransferase N6AMT1 isoform X3 n=1 Tax=Odocoileus virginianus TaxID=9874 RepID=A0ABM4H6M5_ODOVR
MAAPSFPTPLYGHVGRGAFSDVYEPAEDTFLLLDALEAAAGELTGVEICLEVGSGSGVVSAFLASVIGPQALYMCTDVNPEAAACTLETARCNKVHIQPVITDLVKGLLPRLKEKVDLLVFNPPYVVTPPEEADSLPAEQQGKPKNTRVDSLSLFQWIFPTQESNQDLLHCKWILYQLSYQGILILLIIVNY